MNVTEITCKSSLTPSGIPGVDYSLNPYRGCFHRCAYCYATYLGRWHHPGERWGTFVDVRVNAPDQLTRQLRRLAGGTIHIGTATDPYQPIERRYEVTRACLQRLTFFADEVAVLTKSDLVVRDADIIASIPAGRAGLTITTTHDDVARVFEPSAPSPSRRLAALRKLRAKGVSTYAFAGPLLPGISDGEREVDELFGALAEARPSYVLVDTINLSHGLWRQTSAYVARHCP